MVFAVAEDLEAARVAAAKGTCYSYGKYENGHGCGVMLDEPTRVLDLPCAEWHEWSE